MGLSFTQEREGLWPLKFLKTWFGGGKWPVVVQPRFLHSEVKCLKESKGDFLIFYFGMFLKGLSSVHLKWTTPTSIWILHDWHVPLENCLMSLKNLQIYHTGKFAYVSSDAWRLPRTYNLRVDVSWSYVSYVVFM